MGARTAAAVAFGVTFAAMLVVALLQGPKPFHYDSGLYWGLGDTFVKDGAFSLLNFENPLRGYLLPLINHGLAGIADALDWNASSLAKVFNAAVLALIAAVLAPRLAAVAWPERRWSIWTRLGLAVLLVVFWRSYLNFPLSDFPALAAVLVALIAAGRADAPGWMLVAGLATAVAINMRPSYIVVIPIVLGLVALSYWDGRSAAGASLGRRAVCVLALLLGFVAISLPQSLATHRHHDQWSFVPGAAAGLSTLQFTEGMRLQRYETYVGADQPGPSMRYEDRTGKRILEERGDETIETAGEYLGIVVDHPFEMAGLFGRHVVNGLDARYPTPYVEEVDTGSQRWMRLLGFLLMFLALVRVGWPAARRSLGRTRWRYPGALLLCALPSVASAVETRFLLPVYLLAYLLVLTPGWPNPLAAVPDSGARVRRVAVLLVCFALYMAVVLRVVGNATEQLRFV